MKNLPMDLLRTFVTIHDLKGFTQAGEKLGRSQPAISLQMKRLEEMLNLALFNRSGSLSLTPQGETLYEYARKILDLNDSAVTRMLMPSVSGSIRLGIPNDFEVSFLPLALARFSNAYPNVTLDVSSDLSVNLRKDYRRGHFDLVMSMDEYPSDEILAEDAIIEPLSWISAPGFKLEPGEPVPLVLYPKGCVYRQHITDALSSAGIPWRVVYSTPSLLGIQAAIEAGLGISALASTITLSRLRTDKALGHLPSLGEVAIGFNYSTEHLSPAVEILLDYLKTGLNESKRFQTL
ncbi:LysR substrate-binding domain-containing protein [Nitrincola alkalilacustris]|uniref:LysR substrate-binding domain-containing protein n=1 Tax=Nitrincola alkalilacustris TaxID=1571224 RepID=UPI00124C806C|nr:LysR substrate-binding domain-containing protein [Nitrincola alkalilacustris]